MYISDISASRKKPSGDPSPVVTAQPAADPEPVVIDPQPASGPEPVVIDTAPLDYAEPAAETIRQTIEAQPVIDPQPVIEPQPAAETAQQTIEPQPAARTFAASQPYPDAEKAAGLAAHYSEETAPADFTSTEALEKKYEDPKPAETQKAAKPSRRIPLRIARNYLIVAVICAAVGVIYELFSHQVWSVFMIGAFAVPLVLGVLPNLVIAIGRLKTPSLAAENLYACGLVTLTLGSLLKGVLQIYGTTNELLDYYWLVGAGFACLGIIFYFAQKKPVKRS